MVLCSSSSFPVTCDILTDSVWTSFVEIGSWIEIQICTPDEISWAWTHRCCLMLSDGRQRRNWDHCRGKSPGYWTHQVSLVLFTERLGLCVLGTVWTVPARIQQIRYSTNFWLISFIKLTIRRCCVVVSVPTGGFLCYTEACEYTEKPCGITSK